jgi:excisionase family DNA binding protein
MSAVKRVPDIMTPEQAAEYLQVNRETIYRYIRQGKLMASKLGRSYRIPRRSVELLLWSGRMPTDQPPVTNEPSSSVEPYALTTIRDLATDMGVDDLAARHTYYAHGWIVAADTDDAPLNGA